MDYKISYLYSLIGFIFNSITLGSSSRCGPLGFHAESLLKPGIWYFDLPKASCPPKLKLDSDNGTSTKSYCRIYMSLCQTMLYHCSGTVCGEFLIGDHINVMLGKKATPFDEGVNEFSVSYQGEKLPCSKGSTASSTHISFMCNKNSTWTHNDTSVHDQSKAPDPISAIFDPDTCKYNVVFNYSGACLTFEPGETAAETISMGSIALILFFPGLVLYFIIGVLVNRMRGRTGKESIPHHQFWFDLPELIMDGFIFTMSALTCQKEDTKMNYDTM